MSIFNVEVWTRGRAAALAACVGVALSEAAAVFLCYAHERSDLRTHMYDTRVQDDPTEGRFAFYAPGIDRPAVRAAGDAEVADDEEILGVEVAGRFRAYRIQAMSSKYTHIINDVVGDRPVSVTYCDIASCAVGFTAGRLGRPGEPLAISQGGLFDGGMVICVGKAEYAWATLRPLRHDGSVPAFPYERISLTRSTWGKWRNQHPETDICQDLPIPRA